MPEHMAFRKIASHFLVRDAHYFPRSQIFTQVLCFRRTAIAQINSVIAPDGKTESGNWPDYISEYGWGPTPNRDAKKKTDPQTPYNYLLSAFTYAVKQVGKTGLLTETIVAASVVNPTYQSFIKSFEDLTGPDEACRVYYLADPAGPPLDEPAGYNETRASRTPERVDMHSLLRNVAASGLQLSSITNEISASRYLEPLLKEKWGAVSYRPELTALPKVAALRFALRWFLSTAKREYKYWDKLKDSGGHDTAEEDDVAARAVRARRARMAHILCNK
jgi:hypothetical protein